LGLSCVAALTALAALAAWGIYVVKSET